MSEPLTDKELDAHYESGVRAGAQRAEAQLTVLRERNEALETGLEQVWRIAARAQRGGVGSAILDIEGLLRALLGVK